MVNNLKSKLSLVLTVALLFTIILPVTTFTYANEQVNLTILGTSDLHDYIYPYDYKLGKDLTDSGISRVSTIVKQVRSENPNTLLIDNGDTIQGTEITDLYKNDTSVTFPIIATMNSMKYDAMVLGNHEFNYGLDILKRILGEANFPILSANTYNKADGTNFVKPYIVKEVQGVKIGILGLTTPNPPRWDGDKVKDLEFKSLITEADKWVKVLREQEHVDLVFVSIHAGLEKEYWEDGGDSVRGVAENVKGIDAILAGHAHSLINETINNILILEPGRYGNNVARFDFTLEKGTDGKWNIVTKKAENIPTKNVTPDQEILDLNKSVHDKVLAYVNTPIGEATADFVPAGGVKGIPTAQIQDTAIVDFINKVQLEYTKADVSLAAIFKADTNFKKGPLSIKDAANIYMYDNTLIKTTVTGAQLKAIMERSANYFNTYKPGDVTISFDPDIRMYNYDMFAGVSYDINISKEPGNRIENLKFNGKPVSDDQVLTLAVNNYRYNNLVKDGLLTGEVLMDSYLIDGDEGQIRNLIIKYVKEHKTVEPVVDNNWKIVGAPLNHWAKADAIKLINDGIINLPVSEDGRTVNVASVNLDKPITRGEFVTFLIKGLHVTLPETKTTQFTDVNEKLAPYVELAKSLNITNGTSSTTFSPDQILTREQAVTMMMRAYAKNATLNLNGFKDGNKVSSWAIEGMKKAYSLGLVKGYNDKTIRANKELTYGELVTLLNRYLTLRFKQIDLYSTNDFHGAIEGNSSNPGSAKLKSYVDYYRALNPDGTFVLDAGDAFQGTPVSNLHRGKPVVEAMNAIGYDAMTVGNHEFDWSIEEALKSLSIAKFPLLSANIYEGDKLVDWVKPYTIIEKNGVKVGIIGLSTPETAITAHADYVGKYTFRNPVEVVNNLVPELKAKGAEVIVVLGHIPGYQDKTTKEITGELADLAKGVSGVDAIIGGHSHQTVSGIINNAAVTEAYYSGRSMGHITLYYDKFLNKTVDKKVEVIDIKADKLKLTPDANVLNIVNRYVEELKPMFSVVLGKTSVDLKRDYNNESNMGNWVTDVMREKANVQIAFTNAGGLRDDIMAGDITVEQIFKVMPFDNTIVTGEMTGAQLKATLEQSVTLYKGMLQISGLTVKYDSTKPEKERITEIRLADGTLVEDGKTYTVATNDFLSGGQDGFTMLKDVKWTNTFILVRDAMIDNIKTLKEIAPKVEGRYTNVGQVTGFVTSYLAA